MLEIKCPVGIKCGPVDFGLEGDFPISNYSSEAPDRELFIGINWGWNYNLPPLGTNWNHSSCIGICVSAISQDDADLCAARNNLLCVVNQNVTDPLAGDGGGGDPNYPHRPNSPDPPTFYNSPQTCTYECPDGSTNTYTVPGGTFVSTSQAQANAMAHSHACNEVRKRAICLSDLFNWSCLGDEILNGTITVERGLIPPMSFEVSAGTLPDGLMLIQLDDQTGTIVGTATKAGTFVFSIKATNALGFSNEKQYTVRILGLTNGDQVTPAKCDQPYTFQFEAAGSEGTVTFTQDLLYPPPAGLLLNSNGELAGTPTGFPSTTLMKVVVTDTITLPGGGTEVRSCTCDATITVNGPKFVAPFPGDGTQCSTYGPFTFTTVPTGCTFSGTVPGGLHLSSSGVVTGVPSNDGSNSFHITAVDSQGNSNTWSGTINVTSDGTGIARAVSDLGTWVYTVISMGPGSSIPVNNVNNGIGVMQMVRTAKNTFGTEVNWTNDLARCALTADYALTGVLHVDYNNSNSNSVNWEVQLMVCGRIIFSNYGIGGSTATSFNTSLVLSPPSLIPIIFTHGGSPSSEMRFIVRVDSHNVTGTTTLNVSFTITPPTP